LYVELEDRYDCIETGVEMNMDIQHQQMAYQISQIEHRYSKKVRILSNPYLMSLLNDLSRPNTYQPQINYLIEQLYRNLCIDVVNNFFPREIVSTDTRMKQFGPHGVFTGELIAKSTRVITVDLARAGTFPSHVCFDIFNNLLTPANIRQDHIYINRKVNAKEEVVGVDFSGSKVGGDKEAAIVVFPDPMGATGGTISYAINHYKNKIEGQEIRFIAMHLVITPEYIQKITSDHPDLEVVAIRLDRGLSAEKILKSIPGSYPAEERGLNSKQYIVPGLGGVGEILNNSFV